MDPSSSSLASGSRSQINMDEKVCGRTRLKYRLVLYLKGCVSEYMRVSIYTRLFDL